MTDTVAGILPLTKTLSGLHTLAKHRRAQYDSGIPLQSFLVLGRYLFDTCGQIWMASLELNDVELDPDLIVSPVVDTAQLFASIGVTMRSFARALPEEEDRCAACHGNFTPTTARYAIRFDDGFMHDHCVRHAVKRREYERLRKIFDEAGMHDAVLQMIENEYHRNVKATRDAPLRRPWFAAHMPYGIIKYGRRKRVDEIQWQGARDNFSKPVAPLTSREVMTRLSSSTLFQNESVTKGDAMIHAWSDDKAVEYLKIIHNAMLAEMKR